MGAPCSGLVWCLTNHYPRSREHFFNPSARHQPHPFGGLGLMHRDQRRPDLHRYGTFRPRQTGFAAILSGTGKRHSQPRHLLPGARDAGPGGFPTVVSGVYGAVCGRHCGCGGLGWQDLAPFLRPGRRAFAAAFGQRLGGRAALGVGTSGRGRQIQRDYRSAQTAGNAEFARQGGYSDL